MAPDVILTVNSGSSSVKFSLYRMGKTEERERVKGSLDRIGIKAGLFRVTDNDRGKAFERHADMMDHDAAFRLLFAWLAEALPGLSISAVGHRVVHGGTTFIEPHVVTEAVMRDLMRLTPLAPDHLPHELKAMAAVRRAFPDLPQVACFDTAFHRRMPLVARMYPLPRYLWREGVHRYGFHGLSYEYIMAELAKEAGQEAAKGRVIVAHLGNGASMAAVREGRAVDTTMGFTPTGGLMMGTRPGDLDPGLVFYLLEEKRMRLPTAKDMLNQHAGLIGVSGISSDMEELQRLESSEDHAREAIELFCYQAKKFAGALAAVLGGLDTLIFTAGIGENSPGIRERICSGLEFLGITLDTDANRTNKNIISAPGGRVTVRVMRTNEELMIARHTARLLETLRPTHGQQQAGNGFK